MYQVLADAVLLLHFAVVVFVVGGLVAIIVFNLRGGARAGSWGRSWVNGPAFRWTHLAAIGVVVLQSWLGATCPLTTLENGLRRRAGQAAYEASFIEHWVSRLLFHEAPGWLFVAAYTVFGLAVLAAWWRWPPSRRGC